VKFHRYAALAVVALAAILPYVPSLGGDFIYDDHVLIVRNGHTHSLDSPGRFFTDPETLSAHGSLHSYRPIRTLLFAIEWAIFGARAPGFRVVSALMHAGVAILLLLWMRRLGLPDGAATIAAALFAVHPVAVEAVAWISIQGDLLMAGAMIGSMMLLEVDGEPSPRRLVASVALFFLALGGKEAAVVLPALLLVRRLWPMGVVRGPSMRTIAIFGICAGAYLLLRGSLIEQAAHRPWYGGSRWHTYGAVVFAVNYYSAAILLPVELTIRWAPPPTPPAGPVEWALLLTGALILLGLVRWAILERTRRPVAAGGIAMLLLALVPAANLTFPLPTVSELRYLYLPLAFVALAAARLLGAAPWPAAIAMLALMGGLAERRAVEWTTRDALWGAALERPRSTPEALMAMTSSRMTATDTASRTGDVDPPSLLEARDYFLRYIMERQPIVMHPDEFDDVIRLARDIGRRLRAAGREAAAEELRETLLGRWGQALRGAGRTKDARRLTDALRRW